MRGICRSQGAFTLLEVMIVLAILGFIAGLAVPRLEKVYTSIQLSMQRSEVLRYIAELGYLAWSNQQPVLLTRYPFETTGRGDASPLEQQQNIVYAHPPLPDDWRIVAKTPIRYTSNGVCSGGTITLFIGELARIYNLRPPFCVPEQVGE